MKNDNLSRIDPWTDATINFCKSIYIIVKIKILFKIFEFLNQIILFSFISSKNA